MKTIIKYTILSELVTGHPRSIQKNRIPDIHKKSIKELEKRIKELIKNWYEEYYNKK